MKKIIRTSIFILILGFASQASATIMLTPSTPGIIPGTGLGPSNCEAGCVYDAFGLIDDGSLSLLYKADQGGPESGSFAGDYTTTFANSSTDPEDALITHDIGSTDFISCPDCYLAIKDGNSDPSYYFYDLSAWDGSMNIDMQDFWPGRGAISHVSIWGRDGDDGTGTGTGVPEPATLALLGLGLLGISVARRRS